MRGSAARRAARSASASGTVSVSGYQRSARSQSRWPPRRPTIATTPRPCRISSMIATLRAAVPAVRLALQAPSDPRARVRAAGRGARARGAHSGGTPRSSFRNSLPRRSHAYLSRRRAHACAHERQRLDRPDVRVPLEELALDPEQPLELGRRRTHRAGSRARAAAAARRSRSGRSAGSRAGGPCRGSCVRSRRAAARAPRCAAPARG